MNLLSRTLEFGPTAKGSFRFSTARRAATATIMSRPVWDAGHSRPETGTSFRRSKLATA